MKTTKYFDATRQQIKHRDALDRPRFQAMKICHFEDTDTLLIELKPGQVADTRDLDEDTLLDLDTKGQVLAITLEHATQRAELGSFTFDWVTA